MRVQITTGPRVEGGRLVWDVEAPGSAAATVDAASGEITLHGPTLLEVRTVALALAEFYAVDARDYDGANLRRFLRRAALRR
jgi:hypothetical protein